MTPRLALLALLLPGLARAQARESFQLVEATIGDIQRGYRAER